MMIDSASMLAVRGGYEDGIAPTRSRSFLCFVHLVGTRMCCQNSHLVPLYDLYVRILVLAVYRHVLCWCSGFVTSCTVSTAPGANGGAGKGGSLLCGGRLVRAPGEPGRGRAALLHRRVPSVGLGGGRRTSRTTVCRPTLFGMMILTVWLLVTRRTFLDLAQIELQIATARGETICLYHQSRLMESVVEGRFGESPQIDGQATQ